MHEHKLIRLHETAGIQPIEIDATGQIVGVKLHFVEAGVDVGVDELCDFLAESVEDRESNVRSMRQSSSA